MSVIGGNEVKEEKADRLKSVPLAENDAEAQSPPVKAALGALRIYKVYLSAHMPGGCRFEPTCSMYAYQAIGRFGVMRGTWLGLKRLLRCHPLSRRFGYDPVPEKAEVEALKTAEAEQDAGRAGVSPREAHS
jgi:putative membrane protein insertion efficiency factor